MKSTFSLKRFRLIPRYCSKTFMKQWIRNICMAGKPKSSSAIQISGSSKKMFSSCFPIRNQIDFWSILQSPTEKLSGKQSNNTPGDDFTKGMEIYDAKEQWKMMLESLKDRVHAGLEISTENYNQVMKACLDARKSRVALSLFKELRRSMTPPNRTSYWLALLALRPSRNGIKALSLFSEMKWCGGEPVTVETYEALLAVLAEAGMHGDALAILHQMAMDNLTPREETYAFVLQAFVKDKRADLALNYIQDLLVTNKDVLTEKLFNEILQSLADLEMYTNAVELFEWAQENREASLGVNSYMIALKAYAKEQLWHPHGVESLDEPDPCKSVWTLLADMKSQSWVDSACYNVLIDVVCESQLQKQKQKQLKLNAKSRQKVNSTDNDTANSIFNIQPSLFDLISIMNEEGHAPDEITFNTALKGCSEWGEAVKILDEMKLSSIPPTTQTYNTVIKMCATQEQWRKSLDLLNEIKKSPSLEPNVITYNAAILACRVGLQYEKAIMLLEEMKERGLTPDTYNINATISSCAESNCWTQAVKLLQYLRNEGLADIVSFNSAMHACNRAKVPSKALDLFDELKAESYSPDAYTYTTALVSCSMPHSGQWSWEKAVKFIQEMKEKGIELNTQHFHMALKACSRGGAFEEAKSLMGEMRAVCAEECNQGKVSWSHMTNHNLVLKACGRSKSPMESIKYFKEMEEMNIKPDTISYNTVMKCYLERQMYEEAIDLLDLMKINNVNRSLRTYNNALRALKHLPDDGSSQAWDLYVEMLNEKIIPEKYTIYLLLDNLSRRGVLEEHTFKILEQLNMCHICPSVEIFDALVSRLPKSSPMAKELIHFGVTEGKVFKPMPLESVELEFDKNLSSEYSDDAHFFYLNLDPNRVTAQFMGSALKELIQHKALLIENSHGSGQSTSDLILFIGIKPQEIRKNTKKAANSLNDVIVQTLGKYSTNVSLLEKSKGNLIVKF